MQDDQLLDLISRCALRDQAALKTLFEKTSPYLNRIAFNILRAEDLSNDVLQDAFIQIWEKADNYRPDIAKPLTWMGSIVRYRAIDRLAKETKHNAARDVEAEIGDISSPAELESDLESDERRQAFFDCLATLQQRGQDCIKLAYLYGYSREELATKFETNTNTIKSWLSRNTKRLKTCLTNKGLATQ